MNLALGNVQRGRLLSPAQAQKHCMVGLNNMASELKVLHVVFFFCLNVILYSSASGHDLLI